MARFEAEIGRKKIFFSDHALDRWWERCEENHVHGRKEAMALLRERLADAEWSREQPPWAHLSLWHRGRADGFLMINGSACFVVNKNPSKHLVAVTYLEEGRWDH